ncbi:hypothetical protein ACYOEI_26915 [Singulisphaera rosea]
MVLVFGPRAPRLGDIVLARRVQGQWIAEAFTGPASFTLTFRMMESSRMVT